MLERTTARYRYVASHSQNQRVVGKNAILLTEYVYYGAPNQPMPRAIRIAIVLKPVWIIARRWVHRRFKQAIVRGQLLLPIK